LARCDIAHGAYNLNGIGLGGRCGYFREGDGALGSRLGGGCGRGCSQRRHSFANALNDRSDYFGTAQVRSPDHVFRHVRTFKFRCGYYEAGCFGWQFYAWDCSEAGAQLLQLRDFVAECVERGDYQRTNGQAKPTPEEPPGARQ